MDLGTVCEHKYYFAGYGRDRNLTSMLAIWHSFWLLLLHVMELCILLLKPFNLVAIAMIVNLCL
jgi:hypothetical protein